MLKGAVYSSTFIFATKQFDDEFHRLDQAIAAAAKALPGYLGEEAWENPATGLVSNVYYWSSLEALQQLMSHPSHLQAKAAQANWLAGYRVVIAQVMRAYGGGEIGEGVVMFDAH
jgi:heme-degrading monooxygenase HmoA